MSLAQQALDRVAIGSGTVGLDVACGSGAVAIPAARRRAEITAVDLAPAMIERLTARARGEGLRKVERPVRRVRVAARGCRSSRISSAALREIVRVTSGTHVWNVVTAGDPIAVQVTGALEADERAEVQRVLDTMLRERGEAAREAVLHNEIAIDMGTK